MSLEKAFRAGFVRRWHMNPELCHTVDRVDGHAGRVARIILMLNPGVSVGLLRSALIHDDGESVVGDVKAPSKEEFPIIADALEELECMARGQIWGVEHMDHPVGNDAVWLKFADRLDAFMWAKHHAPHVMNSDGWPAAKSWLLTEAARLNVSDKIDGLSTQPTAAE
jgi:5'-deoxynucleotidase YfbR-like HD superfamily hydrolase